MRETRSTERLIGTYVLGTRTVRLLYDPGLIGATFEPVPDTNGIPELVVGFQTEDWDEVIDNLLHEAFEFSMMDLCCTSIPHPQASMDSGSYIFHMNHSQFAEVTARVSKFLAKTLPDLKMTFRKHLVINRKMKSR
jgi:hypothetical protein